MIMERFLPKKYESEKGFTLVELMIVVAIIGILAAIAIPQFAAYRTRAYNSSAESDIKNIQTSEAAFFSDWQAYGQTVNAAPGAAIGPNGGTILTGPGGANTMIGDYIQGAARTIQIGLGNGVSIVANTDANMASFAAVAKHAQGDTYWGVDGDITALFFAQDPNSKGQALAAANAVSSTTGDDFTGNTCPGTSVTWVAK